MKSSIYFLTVSDTTEAAADKLGLELIKTLSREDDDIPNSDVNFDKERQLEEQVIMAIWNRIVQETQV